MKFGYTFIFVENVLQTANFYEKAFGISVRFIPESKLYVEMETGATALGFVSEKFVAESGASFTKNRTGQPAAGIEIAFVTDYVQAAFDKAVAVGAHPIATPTVKPWEQTVALVKDLNGVLVELCSAIQM